jgi:hypothetical protein
MGRGCEDEAPAGYFTLNYYSHTENSTKCPPMELTQPNNTQNVKITNYFLYILYYLIKGKNRKSRILLNLFLSIIP